MEEIQFFQQVAAEVMLEIIKTVLIPLSQAFKHHPLILLSLAS
jgi:hypothetical protein